MIPDYGSANLAVAASLVDALALQGVGHVVICPGSRSTPLAVACAAHGGVRCWVHIDERAAAFFALGMARQLHAPVALLCTSGTAAANFSPAIVEAYLSRIPLIVLTADRPPELRDWGAAQTINQTNLYGPHVKWFAEFPVPDGDPNLPAFARAAAARAVSTALSPPFGPVHFNLPFREPLLPEQVDLSVLHGDAASHSPVMGYLHEGSVSVPPDNKLAEASDLIANRPRGVIVCGPLEERGAAAAIQRLAQTAGYPILADALSPLRFSSSRSDAVIDSYDLFLRDASVRRDLQPEIVIRCGAAPTSKPLNQFLASIREACHLTIDPGSLRDPAHLTTIHLSGAVAPTMNSLVDHLSLSPMQRNSDWLLRWQATNGIASLSVASAMAKIDESFEGRAIWQLADLLPSGATLVVGNSMPIRDVDAYVHGDSRDIRIVGNRGANGIDGLNSTALGAAAVSKEPVALVLGDLSFLHDLGGLLAARRFSISLTIVVLNNSGGGIFSFLPQHDQLDSNTFELLFGTPTDLNVAGATALFGGEYVAPSSWHGFRRAVTKGLTATGLTVIEITTDREHNLAVHRAIAAEVVKALAPEAVGVS